MATRVDICSVEVENLRGFSSAQLDMQQDFTLLVGPNNSGKTSILRLINWLLNEAEESVLLGRQPVSTAEAQLLLPARQTRNAARRLTLWVRVVDGRRRARFSCENGVARLRVGLTMPYGVLRLRINLGPPRRNEEADPKEALTLFREIREDVAFKLIPASRDASSETFTTTFREALGARLEERALHARASGAPAEYRAVKGALDALNAIARRLATPLWDDMSHGLPAGLTRKGTLEPEISPGDLVGWIAQNIVLKLSTGDHDADAVAPTEVGSGLQSLLELAIQQTAADAPDVTQILAVEEPEAFLHPSAQRTLARLLLGTSVARRIVSTHSATLVDEAPHGTVVLVRDHQFYPPAPVTETQRAEINSALLAGHGAEMAFARSVLLVEGDSDRQYFEQLRRRLAAQHSDGRLDELFVVPVGSKTAFGPWLRLLQGYGTDGDRPIRWAIAADSDAPTDVMRACRDAGITVPHATESAYVTLAQANSQADRAGKEGAVSAANTAASSDSLDLDLLAHDLEWCALKDHSPASVASLLRQLPVGSTNRDELLDRLGSKYGNPARDALKAPFARALIARETPWSEVSSEVKDVLLLWLKGAMGPTDAQQLMAGMP